MTVASGVVRAHTRRPWSGQSRVRIWVGPTPDEAHALLNRQAPPHNFGACAWIGVGRTNSLLTEALMFYRWSRKYRGLKGTTGCADVTNQFPKRKSRTCPRTRYHLLDTHARARAPALDTAELGRPVSLRACSKGREGGGGRERESAMGGRRAPGGSQESNQVPDQKSMGGSRGSNAERLAAGAALLRPEPKQRTPLAFPREVRGAPGSGRSGHEKAGRPAAWRRRRGVADEHRLGGDRGLGTGLRVGPGARGSPLGRARQGPSRGPSEDTGKGAGRPGPPRVRRADGREPGASKERVAAARPAPETRPGALARHIGRRLSRAPTASTLPFL